MDKLTKILSVIVLFASFSVHAEKTENENQSTENKLKFIGGVGLTFGGDDILNVGFTDGTSEEMEAGGLYDLKLGVLYELPSSGLSIQTTIGYHGDSVDAENGDASFSRIPVDLLAFYNINEHRIGLGSTYHFNANLDVNFSSVGTKFDSDFDDTVGFVLEYGYQVERNFILGVRYVDIEYTFENTSIDLDGSHAGIYAYITY